MSVVPNTSKLSLNSIFHKLDLKIKMLTFKILIISLNEFIYKFENKLVVLNIK